LDDKILLRNICIGLIDGLIIPLAAVAGLYALSATLATIVIACLAVSIAGAMTMSIGGFMEARKYEPDTSPSSSGLVIGLSYFVGGSTVCFPFLVNTDTTVSLQWATAVSLVLLSVAGFFESAIHGKSGWTGAVRVVLTGAVAATAAFLIAKLFV
jgi:VIT1/CCC1 family predicted Fe2+/Mn2+ transporter